MAESERDVIRVRAKIPRKPQVSGFRQWVSDQLRRDRADAPEGTAAFPFQFRDGIDVVEVRASQGGLLGKVDDVTDSLATEFPWSRDRIAMWLVCGAPVPPIVHAKVEFSDVRRTVVFPVKGGSRDPLMTDTTSRLTLTVDPALSAREVGAIFTEARARLLGGLDGSARLRLPEERAMALARFALEQPETSSDAPWSRWLAEWNDLHPEDPKDRYEGARASEVFRRAVRTALNRLTRVGWLADETEDE
jgi:hypothetical protein